MIANFSAPVIKPATVLVAGVIVISAKVDCTYLPPLFSTPVRLIVILLTSV
nr:MAG TPA: hypothetical protein [Caudoviricetes sp.]